MPYCMTCKHRDAEGYCESGKIVEDAWLNDKDKSDMLVYDFQEGGGFWVGERFGCVHHTHKNEQEIDNDPLVRDGDATYILFDEIRLTPVDGMVSVEYKWRGNAVYTEIVDCITAAGHALATTGSTWRLTVKVM